MLYHSFFILALTLLLFPQLTDAERIRISRNVPIVHEHIVSDDITITYLETEETYNATIYKSPKINGSLIYVGNENVDLPDVINSETAFCNMLGRSPIERDVNMSEFDIALIPDTAAVAIISPNSEIRFQNKKGVRHGIPTSIASTAVDLMHLYQGYAAPGIEPSVVERNYFFQSMYCGKPEIPPTQ